MAICAGMRSYPDRILTAAWNGSGWGAPQTAVTAIPGLTDLAFARQGTQATLAWTTAITPTGSVTPTLQLFSSRWSGSAWAPAQRLTTDAIQHTRPQIVYRAGQPYLAWLAGDALALQSLTSLAANGSLAVAGAQTADAAEPASHAADAAALASGLAAWTPLQSDLQVDQFRVLPDAGTHLWAVFTGQRNQQRDLYLAYYDAAVGAWGQPQTITNDVPSESYPAAGLDSSQRLLMAFSRTQVLTQTHTTTLPGTTQPVTYTMKLDGQTDLASLSHSLRRDLAVESLTLSDEHPAAGSSVVVTATVTNRGDRPLQNVALAFRANGVPFSSPAIPGPLTAGQTITLTANYTPPATGPAVTLSAVVDPANAIVESDETNNSASRTAFGPDLALDEITFAPDGARITVHAVVRNLGPAAAPASRLALYRTALTTPPLASQTFGALAPGAALTVTLTADLSGLPAGSQPLIAAVNPQQADFAERLTEDNQQAFAAQTGPDLALAPEGLWATPLNASAGAGDGGGAERGQRCGAGLGAGLLQQP